MVNRPASVSVCRSLLNPHKDASECERSHHFNKNRLTLHLSQVLEDFGGLSIATACSSVIVRIIMRTLNNLSDLKESWFGRPPPRHGLNLLWWFAHECVQIDSNDRMIALCNPENGAFGFHRFYNADGLLLPQSYLPYYEVGNLKKTVSLPGYVTEKYTGWSDESNTDRIIVSFDSRRGRFDSVYVTRHSGVVNFDQNHTYRISIDLLKEIKRVNREGFLREMMNNQMYFNPHSNIHSQFTASPQSLQGQKSHQSTSDDFTCCAFLLFVLFIFFCLFALFMKK